MKELISTYVSLFLIISPAFSQSKFSVGTPSDEVKDWTLTLSSGAIHRNVQFRELRGDSLTISEMGITKAIYIESIDKISATKGKSKAGKGALLGFITGALIGVALGVLYQTRCSRDPLLEGCSGNPKNRVTIDVILIGGIVGIPFALLGAVSGSQHKYVEEYDMSDLSFYEKRDKIQKIMKK